MDKGKNNILLILNFDIFYLNEVLNDFMTENNIKTKGQSSLPKCLSLFPWCLGHTPYVYVLLWWVCNALKKTSLF